MTHPHSGKVMTVTGPVDPGTLGFTQMHEHLAIDFLAGDPGTLSDMAMAEAAAAGLDWEEPITLANHYAVRRNPFLLRQAMQLNDEGPVRHDVQDFAAAGGGTIVDVTPIGLGRDPALMRRLSQATGVSIVMGTGHYVQDFHPPELAGMTAHQIADILIRDIHDGADGIRPGIIGEIGLTAPMTAGEATSLRAAVIAQRETGLALTVHPGRDARSPLQAMAIVAEGGGDPERTIIDHLDRTLFDPADLLALAGTGAVCEFDLFGLESRHYPLSTIDMPNDGGRIAMIRMLIDHGHGDRIVISQDIDSPIRLTTYGGEGYGHILRHVIPAMRAKGFSEAEIAQITVDTPRRLLTIA